jgi:hypothetical protein
VDNQIDKFPNHPETTSLVVVSFVKIDRTYYRFQSLSEHAFFFMRLLLDLTLSQLDTLA